MLAPQLLEAGAGKCGTGGVLVETAGLRCLDVAGARRRRGASEPFGQLYLNGDDADLTGFRGGDLDDGVQGDAIAEVASWLFPAARG